jgi:serine/threonine protein kinase
MTMKPGTRLGPYEAIASIGAGGMGEVWGAKDTRLDREVKSISQLNHPHVCAPYDVGEASGVHDLVMELLEGESLAERVKKGPLPLTDVLKFGRQIASALDAAHRRGHHAP